LPNNPKRDERSRLSILLRGGWVTANGTHAKGAPTTAVHDDVLFSLALDDGYVCEPPAATFQPIANRRRLPWLTDTDADPEDR
jgi:hypothetical protein